MPASRNKYSFTPTAEANRPYTPNRFPRKSCYCTTPARIADQRPERVVHSKLNDITLHCTFGRYRTALFSKTGETGIPFPKK